MENSRTSEPLRNAGHHAPSHPILNSALIPRDYLTRSPRSPAGFGSKTPTTPSSSSPQQSPTLPAFPSQPTQPESRIANFHERSAVPVTPSTNVRWQTGDKNIRARPGDIDVVKTRTAVPSPDLDGTTSSLSTSSTQSASKSAAANMPRTSSIDSAISSISHPQGAPKTTDQKEPSIAEIRNLIATAGSAENLVQHLLREKANAASQNAQLWKLVDKQRTLLLGLNKDLERVSKERDRYRRKAKELATAQINQPIDRHVSQSHSPPRTPPTDELPIQLTESNDTQDLQSEPASSKALRSPFEAGMMPPPLQKHQVQHPVANPTARQGKPQAPSLSTDLQVPQLTVSGATPISASPSASFSSKRQIAPKPLDLRSSKEDTGLAKMAAEQAVSDSEGTDVTRSDRGRRKTREEDDRDRDLVVLQQEETRSRSNKGKKAPQQTNAVATLMPPADLTSLPQSSEDTTNTATQYANQTDTLSPPMRSPGLPSSPRPMPASLASPENQQSLRSLPMSPRNGAFALSPRAPKAPIPMPANTQIVHPDPIITTTGPPQHSESLKAAVSQPPVNFSAESPTVYRGLMDPQLPDLLLPPNALPSIQVRVASSRLKPSRFSMLGLKPQEDTSVFTLSIFSRSGNKELWRIEKIPAALPHLDQQIRPRCPEASKLPDRKLFAGHSPATLDARRNAIDQYFDDLLDTHIDEQSALLICKFLSTDVLDAALEPAPRVKERNMVAQPSAGSHKRNGYLTKKGKNFGGWKSRYFVLDGPDFRYFEAPGGAHLGTIKLIGARIGRQTSNDPANADDPENESQYRHAFLILEPKRKDSNSYVRHVLCAENDIERDEWVAALLHWIEDPSRPPTSGADTAAHPRTLLRHAGNPDGHPDAPTKASSPTLGPDNSGSASPTSSETPPLDHGAHDAHARGGNSLGIPLNPKAGNRQSAVGMPQSKVRSLFQFRKSSHEALNGPLNDQRNQHAATRARTGYVRPVFGLTLVEAVEYCGPEGIDIQLPAVVYRCIEYLRGKKAANEEGLFRLSGSNIVIRTLKERFNTEGDIDLLSDEEEYYDVHAVASLFKSYLRELPATILTRDLHIEFLKVLELQTKPEKIKAFNVLVHRLPHVNLVLLRAMSEYLLEVVQNQERNKMTVKNVGIVFAPTLNIPAPVFSMFLTDFESIFGQNPNEVIEYPITITEPPQDDVRSPRRQMFPDGAVPAAYNQNSFAQNANMQPQQHRPAQQQQQQQQQYAGNLGMSRSQSYENGGYVSSVPADHGGAPPQPMYPPPPQPHHQHQQVHGGYRVVEPDNNVASLKQKRRESAMLLF